MWLALFRLVFAVLLLACLLVCLFMFRRVFGVFGFGVNLWFKVVVWVAGFG